MSKIVTIWQEPADVKTFDKDRTLKIKFHLSQDESITYVIPIDRLYNLVKNDFEDSQ